MRKGKFKLSVLHRNYERKKKEKPTPRTAAPCVGVARSYECSSLEDLGGFLEGATNVIPLGWSMVHEDGNPARLIVVKVSAQELEGPGAKVTYSLTVSSDFSYTIQVRGKLLDPSKTAVLQSLPSTVSTVSNLTMVMKILDSSVICSGKKYHCLKGWTKGTFFDRTGKLHKLSNRAGRLFYWLLASTYKPHIVAYTIQACISHLHVPLWGCVSGVCN